MSFRLSRRQLEVALQRSRPEPGVDSRLFQRDQAPRTLRHLGFFAGCFELRFGEAFLRRFGLGTEAGHPTGPPNGASPGPGHTPAPPTPTPAVATEAPPPRAR